jgi:hypothetical protein
MRIRRTRFRRALGDGGGSAVPTVSGAPCDLVERPVWPSSSGAVELSEPVARHESLVGFTGSSVCGGGAIAMEHLA